jgi:putative ABC transport system permease protein
MLGYYLRLALRSSVRNPGVSALIVLAIGLGIGVCVMTLTVYHAMAANPIWWKDQRLYAVTLDSWGPSQPSNPDRPELPPFQLTYTDATHLLESDISGITSGVATSCWRCAMVAMRILSAGTVYSMRRPHCC